MTKPFTNSYSKKTIELKDFFNYYSLISKSGEQLPFDSNKKLKVCRFCGNSNENTKFDSRPHLLPELFGNNNFAWNNECDSCNSKFQKLENDVATLVQPYLTLCGAKTKHKIPEFQSRKTIYEKSTKLKTIGNKRYFDFGQNLNDFTFVGDNRLDISMRIRSLNPFNVYRLLLKMGISLLSEEDFMQNNHYLQYLNNENVESDGIQFFSLYRYVMNSKMFSSPSAELYKAKHVVVKDTEIPEYTLIIKTANLVFQFFLPLSTLNIQAHHNLKSLQFNLFPSFVLDDIKRLKSIEINHFDLSISRKVSFDEIVKFYFKERI